MPKKAPARTRARANDDDGSSSDELATEVEALREQATLTQDTLQALLAKVDALTATALPTAQALVLAAFAVQEPEPGPAQPDSSAAACTFEDEEWSSKRLGLAAYSIAAL